MPRERCNTTIHANKTHGGTCPASNAAAPFDMAYRLPVLIAAGPPATEEFMTMLPLPDASSRGYASCMRNVKFSMQRTQLRTLTSH